MFIVKATDAYNMLGHETYSKNIEEMCKITYVFWYDHYFKTQLDKYPNWNKLKEKIYHDGYERCGDSEYEDMCYDNAGLFESRKKYVLFDECVHLILS